jgi:hypothetical protein
VDDQERAEFIARYKEELYEEYMFALSDAHIAAQKALNLLYRRNGPQRGFWQRRRLGKAQSMLISMYIAEKRKADERN